MNDNRTLRDWNGYLYIGSIGSRGSVVMAYLKDLSKSRLRKKTLQIMDKLLALNVGESHEIRVKHYEDAVKLRYDLYKLLNVTELKKSYTIYKPRTKDAMSDWVLEIKRVAEEELE